MERRLGKGLGSLLGAPAEEHTLRELDLAQIDPNPFQPRESMDPSGLEELRDSITTHGLLQPIVVRKLGDRYQLVSGERRWRAARLAGLDRIPATIREVADDSEMLELALVENVQRRDLDPLERARGFKHLMEALGITQEAVAVKVGLKRATVANHLRLLDLPHRVQEAVGKGLLSMGHARALLALTEPARIEAMMEECVRRDLSVREVERLVREAAARPTTTDHDGGASAPSSPKTAWLAQAERRLQEALGVRVTVQCDSECRGDIRVQFADKAELHRLLERLAPPISIT